MKRNEKEGREKRNGSREGENHEQPTKDDKPLVEIRITWNAMVIGYNAKVQYKERICTSTICAGMQWWPRTDFNTAHKPVLNNFCSPSNSSRAGGAGQHIWWVARLRVFLLGALAGNLLKSPRVDHMAKVKMGSVGKETDENNLSTVSGIHSSLQQQMEALLRAPPTKGEKGWKGVAEHHCLRPA